MLNFVYNITMHDPMCSILIATNYKPCEFKFRLWVMHLVFSYFSDVIICFACNVTLRLL